MNFSSSHEDQEEYPGENDESHEDSYRQRPVTSNTSLFELDPALASLGPDDIAQLNQALPKPMGQYTNQREVQDAIGNMTTEYFTGLRRRLTPLTLPIKKLVLELGLM
ncbi:hypothetical protein JOB18_016820 [Solea senegalensis]|uniref:Uncharacterized protein n=1 Tax=Solea senegalensis TaxID=28829 RepID=A0AAV6PEE7_SOLSE|nr:hypothetical protein JOB18_016820 [Solea senegalensis]